MKLLVVEDDARVRKMIVAFVADLSDELFEYTDGSQALAGYTEHLPDWVLMDLMMPQTDGIAATRQIIAEFPKAKIIIVTSYESDAMRETAHAAGARGYVLKENLFELREILEG